MPLSLPRWIAHRGGGSLAPENTLLGIRRAAAAGFRAVEFDVMLSADGTPVLIHDETLERTTNGRGRVCETPDAQLFALDAGAGERIPTLVEAAALCRSLGLLANVEIKPDPAWVQRTAEVVVAEVRRCWPAGETPPLISSFSVEALAVARAALPEVPRGLLLAAPGADWRQVQRELVAFSVHCAASEIDAAFLSEAAALGVPVCAYTVNAPEMAKMLFAAGVSALFTDDLRPETSPYNALQLSG